jgi:phage shock protein A
MKKTTKQPPKRLARLEKKEERLVNKGYKAVDEGRDKKADRILGRAAKVENRKIKVAEMKTGGTKTTPKKATPKYKTGGVVKRKK